MIRTRFHWQRPLLLALFVTVALAAVMFGLRTYRSFLLLRSAYELGAPDVGSVRPWMTLDYVARTYRVPEEALAELKAGAGQIDIRYTSLPDGAQIRYTTKDPKLVAALHRWFDAQLADHGHHATGHTC